MSRGQCAVLDAIINNLPVSKPIFKSEVSEDGKSIEFRLGDESVSIVDTGDPVLELVARYYSQRFSVEERRFRPDIGVARVIESIMDEMRNIYQTGSDLKNPTQSKTFRWLKGIEHNLNHPSLEGFVAIYRHANTEKYDPKNMVAIMELMREKYEAE